MHENSNLELERYMNDHLAGASVAILVLGSVLDKVTDDKAVEFFSSLKTNVEDDRQLLVQMIDKAGLETSSAIKIAGDMAGRIGILKFMWEGFEPGKLGLFEALELLTLGIQGKHLLWLVLNEISPSYEGWKQFDFQLLLADAIRQRDDIEAWRIKAAHQCFISSDE